MRHSLLNEVCNFMHDYMRHQAYSKNGSTSYIGIGMVILPYIGTMEKLKFQFSLSVSSQFDFYQHQSGEHVES